MDINFTPPPTISELSPEILAAISDDAIEGALVGYVLDNSIEAEDELDAITHLPSAL